MTSEDHSVDIDGVSLRYSEWSGVSPPVVFLHGLSASRLTWTPTVPARGRRRALACDARGHHDSSRAPGTYTFRQHASDAAAFLEQVVREPAVLVGHSQGAMVTTQVAALHPDRVLAAVLVDPPLYVEEFGLRDTRVIFEGIAVAAGRPVDELVEGGRPRSRAEVLASLDPAVPREALDGTAFEGWDTDAHLSAMRCPTLLLHGERALGSAIYDGELERAASKLSDVTIAAFEGVGHGIHVEQPERFVQVVEEFLDRVSPAS